MLCSNLLGGELGHLTHRGCRLRGHSSSSHVESVHRSYTCSSDRAHLLVIESIRLRRVVWIQSPIVTSAAEVSGGVRHTDRVLRRDNRKVSKIEMLVHGQNMAMNNKSRHCGHSYIHSREGTSQSTLRLPLIHDPNMDIVMKAISKLIAFLPCSQ